MNMADDAKLHSPICLIFEVLVVDVQLSTAMQMNWALSVEQSQLQAQQFLVHLIDLLSTRLRCNGFRKL